MFLRFIPTRSTEARRKTARASRVRRTIVPVAGRDTARAFTPPSPTRAERSHPSPLYDSPEIMTIPAIRNDPPTASPAGDRRRWIALSSSASPCS